jgi:hypothetical protein
MLPMLNGTTAGWYALTAIVGLLPATVFLRRSPARVMWWEYLELVLPIAIWAGLWSIPAVIEGRKSLANLAEPFFLGLIVGSLGIVLRWGGTRFLGPMVLRWIFLASISAAAVLVVLLVPILPE